MCWTADNLNSFKEIHFKRNWGDLVRVKKKEVYHRGKFINKTP